MAVIPNDASGETAHESPGNHIIRTITRRRRRSIRHLSIGYRTLNHNHFCRRWRRGRLLMIPVMNTPNDGARDQPHTCANGNSFTSVMSIVVADDAAHDTTDHSTAHGTVNGTGALSACHPRH